MPKGSPNKPIPLHLSVHPRRQQVWRPKRESTLYDLKPRGSQFLASVLGRDKHGQQITEWRAPPVDLEATHELSEPVLVQYFDLYDIES